jgi:putative oxidoreductase
MGMLQQINRWGATHHPRWLVVLRVALGICLFIKGISFASDVVELQQLLSSSNFTQSFPWLAYFITWVHLFGGFMIIIGLLTRFAVLLQLPILLGAVLFINSGSGILYSPAELGFSLLVLLLLLLFLVEGAGPVSLDNYFKNNPR